MPGHGKNRTYDLWNTSPMLCQLSYVVRSVRVCDISEISIVPSISMQSSNHDFFVLVLCFLANSCIYYDFLEKQCGERIDMNALGMMAKKSRIECLNHAVVQKFMEQKWSLRARKWYWGCLSIYAIFLLFFTTYISLFTEGKSE